MALKVSLAVIVCITLGVTFMTTPRAAAKPSMAKQMDTLFAPWNKPGSPGVAVIVTKNGRTVFKKGYGIANLEYDIPITSTSVFDTCSVSKQFTGFAIATLAEAGKLNVNDEIRKYLPDVPDFGKPVTIQHLLHHTSGMRDWGQPLGAQGWKGDDPVSFDDIITMAYNQQDLNFAPGDEYDYTNTSYNLLAKLVETISGQSFRAWTDEHIFKPLGMKNSHFHDDHNEIVKNLAYSYYPSGEGFTKAPCNCTAVGSSSLYSTAEDLAKWLHNLAEPKVGGKAVINRMMERGKLNNGGAVNYGYGLAFGEYRGMKVIEHGGLLAGYRTVTRLLPDQKMVVVVLSNLGSVDVGWLANKTTDISLGIKPNPEQPAAKPVEHTATIANPALYPGFVGTYKLGATQVATVTTEGDKLFWQITWGPKVELTPESDFAYFDQNNNVLTFTNADQVELTRPNGGKNTGKRVKLLSGKQFDEYAGEYWSEELRTYYWVMVKDGALIARHTRHGDLPLIDCGSDQFTSTPWWMHQVDFKRNEKGKITGFTITVPRMRNLRFTRRSNQLPPMK